MNQASGLNDHAREMVIPQTEYDHVLENVREYWSNHVHDWKIAKSNVGSEEFFRETEEYRFDKLNYLPELVDFEGFRGKTVLDVGCGLGNDLSRFAKHGAEVTGIDLAKHAIELTKKNFHHRNLSGRFAVMNGEAMSFPEDSFDCIYCHTVLHFTPNPKRMVQEIHRVLKPDGVAILMTVNRRSWLSLIQKAMRVEIDYMDAPVFRKYTINEFRDLLSVFPNVEIIPERFPVRTKVHRGIKGSLFNLLFVDVFNAIPKRFVRPLGYHLMAFARKDR